MFTFFHGWRRKMGIATLSTLSVTMFIAQIGVAQNSPSSDSPQKRTTILLLPDPMPEDWDKVSDKEAIAVLELYDLRDEGHQVDNRSLEILSQFRNLKTLVIGCDQLTDEAIPHFLKLKNLEALVLYNGQFTDEGIQKLKELPAVKTIGFCNTEVTERGVRQLQKSIPEAVVELVRYGRRGKVFDQNGCLRNAFYTKHFHGLEPQTPANADEPSNVEK